MKHIYWLRSGTYTLLEKAAALLYGFGGALLLFRLLSKEVFGTWVLFLVVVSIIEVGRIGLLQNALVKYLSEHAGQAVSARINTASLVLNLLLTAVIVALLQALSPWIAALLKAPELERLLRIYSLTTLVLIPFFQFNYIQQAHLDFRGIFFGHLAKGGIVFSYIVFAYFFANGVTLPALAWCQVLAALIGSAVAWHFARPYANYSRQVDWGWVRKLFRFGKFVFGTNLSTQVFRNSDKILLGALPGAGAAAVALYDAAMRVGNLTDIPTNSMATMLFPQSARHLSDMAMLKDLYEKAVGAVLAFMLPVILIVQLLSEWIIRMVAGPDYSASAGLLRIVICFGLFIPYAVQFGTLLDSVGRPRVNFGYTLASLLLTAGFNLALITVLGVYGAAIGTLIAYGLSFCLMQWYLYRHYRISPLRPFVHAVYFYRSLAAFCRNVVNGRQSLRLVIALLISRTQHEAPDAVVKQPAEGAPPLPF